MKKIYILFFLFLLFNLIGKVNAKEYIQYSEWTIEYPYWLGSIFIESESRFLWYREIINDETGEVKREETKEYYKELDGYIKIEGSEKKFYRYISNKYVLLDGSSKVVYNDSFCIKEYCSLVKLPDKPEEQKPEVIDNPKTYDNIFVFLIISFISFVSLVLIIGLSKNKSSYVESI